MSILSKRIRSDYNFLNTAGISSKHSELGEILPTFMDRLNIPICIYDHLEKKFKYSNLPFDKLSRLTKEDKSRDQQLFGSWIHNEDIALFNKEISGRISELCQHYIHNDKEQLSYTLNFRIDNGNNVKSERQMLIQSNVLEWTESNTPALTMSFYMDINDRRHSNKIVLTANYAAHVSDDSILICSEEYLRLPDKLAPREAEILELILKDKSATAIAEVKHISVFTVRSHWRNILQKTNCRSQKELKSLALVEGWI